MAELQERIDSFKERFNANDEQARFVIATVDKWGREVSDERIATVIMQNRSFYKLGDSYLARQPQYKTQKAINDSYKAALAEMTADILDEVFDVMPKDDSIAPRVP